MYSMFQIPQEPQGGGGSLLFETFKDLSFTLVYVLNHSIIKVVIGKFIHV